MSYKPMKPHISLTLEPNILYNLVYKCRDIGYGVEKGHIPAKWTGEQDCWGKLTFDSFGTFYYLFPDEIVRAEKM